MAAASSASEPLPHAPGAASPCSSMVAPRHSYPCPLSRKAVTLESTPPLMATSTRLRVMGLLGVRMVGMSADAAAYSAKSAVER